MSSNRILATFAAVALAACPGSSETSHAVKVSPSQASLRAGETLRFTASVGGVAGAPVSWSVVEAGGGTIDATGEYTAPAATATFHVIATSVEHPQESARATVEVSDAISIEPVAADVDVLGTYLFTASLPPAYAAAGVSWNVNQQKGGSIQADGTYQAPPDPGEYPIVATSLANPARTATAAARVRYLRVSGTVSYSGTRTGRIHVADPWTGLGTSLDAPGPFTIRGFQRVGSAGIVAWMDVTGEGWFNSAADPAAGPAIVDLAAGSASGLSLVLQDPAPLPVWICCADVVGGDGFAIVQWPRPTQNTAAVADSFEIHWGTTPQPGPGTATGSLSIPAGPNLAVVPLPAGFWYLTVVALQSVTTTSAATDAGVTVGPPAAGHTVSGTVTFPDVPGAPLYVVLREQYGNAAHAVRVASPTSPQPFAIEGVADGVYRAAAFLDRGADGIVGATDPVLPLSDRLGPGVTVAGSDEAGLDLSIPSGEILAEITVDTERYNQNVSWTVRTRVLSNEQIPSRVVLGEGVAVRDLAPRYWAPQQAAPFEGTGATRYEVFGSVGLPPEAGAATPIAITLDGGATVQAFPQVTGILDEVVLTAPVGGGAPLSPTFTWDWPSAAPLLWDLSFYPSAGGGGRRSFLPPGTTSYVLPAPPLDASTTYRWSLFGVDAWGNRTISSDTFTTLP
jgi:hypothetical protein